MEIIKRYNMAGLETYKIFLMYKFFEINDICNHEEFLIAINKYINEYINCVIDNKTIDLKLEDVFLKYIIKIGLAENLHKYISDIVKKTGLSTIISKM